MFCFIRIATWDIFLLKSLVLWSRSNLDRLQIFVVVKLSKLILLIKKWTVLVPFFFLHFVQIFKMLTKIIRLVARRYLNVLKIVLKKLISNN